MSGTVATMGNFDGIHLRHQALNRNTVKESTRLGCPFDRFDVLGPIR